MNILSQIQMLPSLLMNNNSSVFLASESMVLSFLSADNIVTRLLRLLGQLAYFASKWVMYMVDVIYFYILQLAGVNVETTIIDSARSDMTFSLLMDNSEMVTDIIKSLIVIAIVLIIVTSIIAIIKMQASALKEKKAKKNPTGDVMRSALKAIVLIALTPLMAILGIVASSVILQSLFNATNLSQAKSLSARVFNVSASAANKYRMYAENGVRIPIKYKFSGDNKEKAISYAAEMIGNEKFPSLVYFDTNQLFTSSEFDDPVLNDKTIQRGSHKSATDAWVNDIYYEYFDTGERYSKVEGSSDHYRIMQTHVNEYYAMSDVIGYALDTMEPLYFVTIQELLESLPNEEIFNQVVLNPAYHIELLDYNGNVIEEDLTTASISEVKQAFDARNYECIRYTSAYKNGSYSYTHIKDATDEMEGAKFVIAYKNELIFDGDPSIYGDYTTADCSTDPIEKFYYLESSGARYKKVDLYYYYSTDRQEYVKAPTYEPSRMTYYYKIGEDYVEINSQNENKFSYKDASGSYQPLTLGQIFYSSVTKSYYKPLVKGASAGDNPSFTTEYMEVEQIVTARGIFDTASYPTAIRRTNAGDIMFYRDDLEIVAKGSVSSVGTLDQIDPEGVEDDEEEIDTSGGIIKTIGSAAKAMWNSAKRFVSSLFNPLKLVPDLRMNSSAMSTTYTNKTHSVFVMKEGKLHISYFFSDSFTSQLSSKLYGMDLNCLFDIMSINFIILVAGSTVFFKIMVTAIFAFIQRGFSLFLLILTYPIACATLPLDETGGGTGKGAYAQWSKKYTNLLFSTYGLILSINFVFVIIPVIDELTFFTEQNLQENRALGRIAEALRNPLLIFDVFGLIKSKPNYVLSSLFLNKLLRIMFQIAAFSVIAPADGKGGGTFYAAIKDIIGLEPGILEDSPVDAVKKTLKSAAQVVNFMIFPGKALKNAAEKALGEVKNAVDFIPGSAIAIEGIDRGKRVLGIKRAEAATKALMDSLNNKEDKAVVEQKLQEYRKAHNMQEDAGGSKGSGGGSGGGAGGGGA